MSTTTPIQPPAGTLTPSASPIISAAELALERSRGQALLGLSISTTLIAMISCGVRLMLRRRTSRGMWWDDYSVMVAMVMGFVGMIFNSIESTSLSDRIKAVEMDYLAQPLLMFGTTLAKISICFFFLRTIGRRRPWNLLLGLLTVFLALVNLAFALTTNLQCRPLEKLWRPTVEGECFDAAVGLNLGLFQGGFAVFTYFFLATFPTLMVRDAKLTRALRWPFYAVAIAMLVAAIFSIVHVYETSVIGPAPTPFSANVLLSTILAVLTQNLTIIAANVLPLGPLFSSHARDLSRLVATVEDELQEQGDAALVTMSGGDGTGTGGSMTDSSSKRSSFISIKRGTTLIIEGPASRTLGDEETGLPVVPPKAENNHDSILLRPHPLAAPVLVRPTTSHGAEVVAEGGAGRDTIVARHINEAEQKNYEGWDMDAFNNGILRTVSVEVVEEDVTEREIRAGVRSPGEDWKHILKNGPRY